MRVYVPHVRHFAYQAAHRYLRTARRSGQKCYHEINTSRHLTARCPSCTYSTVVPNCLQNSSRHRTARHPWCQSSLQNHSASIFSAFMQVSVKIRTEALHKLFWSRHSICPPDLLCCLLIGRKQHSLPLRTTTAFENNKSLPRRQPACKLIKKYT